MIRTYYVNSNAQSTGEHELHVPGCSFFPTQNAVYLGVFENCTAAKKVARKIYSNVDGCYYCLNECHSR